MVRPLGLVVPLYKEQPNALEYCSLKRCAEVLWRYPVVLLVPKQLNVSVYVELFREAEVLRFAPAWFQGLESYSQLLLAPMFYENFLGIYEKICIVQPDVFLCYDALEEFCCMPYDYFGAPLGLFRHDRYELYGGNGGISLRDVAACLRILQSDEVAESHWKPLEEDEFFSVCGEAFPEKFRVAPLSVAMRFAFDRFPKLLMKINQGRHPMAIHSWYTHDAYFCRQLLANDLPEGLEFGAEDVGALALTQFHEFMRGHAPIVFYGAGDFGKSFLQYAQAVGLDIEHFVISDGQPRNENEYRGKPILYLSECQVNKAEAGVVVVMSRLLWKQISEDLRRNGFQHVFVISDALCNAVLEKLLEQRWCRDGRLDEAEPRN